MQPSCAGELLRREAMQTPEEVAAMPRLPRDMSVSDYGNRKIAIIIFHILESTTRTDRCRRRAATAIRAGQTGAATNRRDLVAAPVQPLLAVERRRLGGAGRIFGWALLHRPSGRALAQRGAGFGEAAQER